MPEQCKKKNTIIKCLLQHTDELLTRTAKQRQVCYFLCRLWRNFFFLLHSLEFTKISAECTLLRAKVEHTIKKRKQFIHISIRKKAEKISK